MFKSAKGLKSWLVHANEEGDVAVFALDKDGNPGNFVAGKVAQVLGPPIRAMAPRAWLVTYPRYPDDDPHSWGFWGGFRRWRHVCAALNGESSVRRGRAEAALRVLVALELPSRDMIEFNDDDQRYVLTARAMAYDEGLDREREDDDSKGATPS